MEGQVQKAEQQLQTMVHELKNKEQENRINKLKLKEVNRFLQQKQIKMPKQMSSEGAEETSQADQSQL